MAEIKISQLTAAASANGSMEFETNDAGTSKKVTGDQLKTFTNSGLGTLSTQAANSVAITGGSINGTTVGATTASTGAFTTLSASSTVSGTGFSTYLASPPAIGGTAAAAGSFTTLSASSTVSGTGFSTYLASPPAIGGTTAAAGSFTTLSASGNVTLSGGTANGVLYLNGSKVATSGSALTFNGQVFTVNDGTVTLQTYPYAAGSVGYFGTWTNHALALATNATERMRIDSSGNLGLGVAPSGNYQLQAGSGVGAAGRGFNLMTVSGGYSGNGYPAIGYNFRTTTTAGSYNYNLSDTSSALGLASGGFQFFTAPSGTAGNTITFTQAMALDASGNLLVGATSGSNRFEVWGSTSTTAVIGNSANTATNSSLTFKSGLTGLANADKIVASVDAAPDASTGGRLLFYTSTTGGTVTERARITSGGDFTVGTTNAAPGSGNVVGSAFGASGYVSTSRDSNAAAEFNRKTNDGDIVVLRQDGTQEGSISVSGTTVSYNAFAGSHWSQLQDGSKPEILRGTVMESIDELCEWPNEAQSERLCRVKISDTASSKKVYGVFMDWDNDWTATNDMMVTSLGAFVCRVNSSVEVQQGDLLESNGDGTARVQEDEIIRSSTIGKVTSTVKTHEHPDGSYCVPTVLYCG